MYRFHRTRGVAEFPLTDAGDFELSAAVWVWAGDDAIGQHPIVVMERPLLCGQKGQKRTEGVHGKVFIFGKNQILPNDIKTVARFVPADHRPVRRDDLHFQIKERKIVVQSAALLSRITVYFLLGNLISENANQGLDSRPA